MEFSEWVLRTLYQQINRFYTQEPMVLARYCDMYAHLVQLGWHVSSDFRAFFDHFQNFFSGDLRQLGSGLYLSASVVTKMQSTHKIETEEMRCFRT
jgi:hypothetical protein